MYPPPSELVGERLVRQTDASRSANNFNGKGNALNLSGDEPSILITGAATLCTGDCSLSLDELGTSVTVSASCGGMRIAVFW